VTTTDELDVDDDRAFRAAVREWIATHTPHGLSEVFDWRSREIPGDWAIRRAEAEETPAYRKWQELCAEARLVCASWPESAGGRGWSRRRKAVFESELHRACVPRIDRGMGEFLLGPTVIARGTEEQQSRLLPPIIRGEHVYCQGFSEPDNGSDLAGLTTRGVVDGDELVITGQKIWTSGAHRSNMIFILVRTDPDQAKHRGLTFAVAPIEDNHVEIAPIRQMSGGSDFAQTYYTGMRTPLTNVIGGLGQGWSVTMTTLGFERDFNLPTLSLEIQHQVDLLVERARLLGVLDDPRVRQVLGEASRRGAVLRLFAERLLDGTEADAQRLVSVTKLYWSEYDQWLTEQAMALEGMYALVRPAGEGYRTAPVQDRFIMARSGTIYAGTSEIQRNIVAERLLGMPR
jgi:alkylation response protein AidB-like acyl-CoA dehydrogenase